MALDDCAPASALNPVRERFCREYHATGNASEAYRRANPRSAKWTPNALNVKASRVLGEAKVRLRLEELQAEAAVRHNTDELETIVRADLAGAAAAAKGPFRLTGLLHTTSWLLRSWKPSRVGKSGAF